MPENISRVRPAVDLAGLVLDPPRHPETPTILSCDVQLMSNRGPKVGGIAGQRLGIFKYTLLINYKDTLYDFKIYSIGQCQKTAILQPYELKL